MMDRRTLLAISLCLGIYVVWFKFFIEPYQRPTSPVSSAQTGGASVSGYSVGGGLDSNAQKGGMSSHSIPVQTTLGKIFFGNSRNLIHSGALDHYKKEKTKEADKIDLSSVTLVQENLSLSFDDHEYAYLNQVQGRWVSETLPLLWQYEDEKIKLQREVQVNENSAGIDLKWMIDFKSRPARYAFLSLAAKGADKDPEAQDRQFLYWTQDSLERLLLKDRMPQKEMNTPVHYVGVSSRYFLLALIAVGPQLPYAMVQPTTEHLSGKIHLVYPLQGDKVTLPVRLYFGPKELETLRAVHPLLEHTIDFGWFTVFAYPILKVLKWIHHFFQNYGIAIIILTLLLKVATYPLTYKSMKSMKKMAALQPEIEALRKRYAQDKEGLNREMMQLMKNKGYNPASGCLPMLIQMPIFFALYRVLYSSIELYHAPFFLWIQDLSVQDPYYITPVLLTLTMYFQQRLTPTTVSDPTQAKVMQWMPVVFGIFMVTLPSGLALYMLVNTVAGMAQQVLLNRRLAHLPQGKDPIVLAKQ